MEEQDGYDTTDSEPPLTGFKGFSKEVSEIAIFFVHLIKFVFTTITEPERIRNMF